MENLHAKAPDAFRYQGFGSDDANITDPEGAERMNFGAGNP